jgi:hypothetical protein
VNPPVPATKIVEASGKSFNTIPPSDFGFFEMINAAYNKNQPIPIIRSLQDNWPLSAL